jgi:hypothetical protein
MNSLNSVERFVVTLFVAISISLDAPATADVMSLADVFTVSSTTAGIQRYPDVAAAPGGFVVAWTGETESFQGKVIVSRRFDDAGVAVGSEHVIGGVSADEVLVRLATLTDGRVFATWQDDRGMDGDRVGVFAAIVNADGTLSRSAFQVNVDHVDGLQRTPDIAVGGHSAFIVWTDDASEISRLTVAAQTFDGDGRMVSGELTLAERPNEVGYWPVVASMTNDGEDTYAVAWESLDSTSPETGYDVVARILSPDGEISNRFVLNEDTSAIDQGNPSIASTPEGFVAAWTTFRFNDWDVYARRFDRSGSPTSAEFRVTSDHLYNQSAPSVVGSASGDFVVLWATTTGGPTVYGRAFNASGVPLGEQFRVSTKLRGFQGDTFLRVGVTFINTTDFVATWTETNGDTDPDVDGRLFRVSHSERSCGDAVGDDLVVRALDALFILRAVVQDAICAPCRCDADNSGSVEVGDAALALRIAVGLRAETVCASCEPESVQ